MKLFLAGVQLINLAAFLFRDWERQDDVPTVLGAKPDPEAYKA